MHSYFFSPNLSMKISIFSKAFYTIRTHFYTSIVAKHQKIEGRKKLKNSERSLTMPKKLKGGTL